MSLKSLLLFGALCGAGVGVSGDLRAASQPKAGFQVRQRDQVQFVSKTVIYMEPSDFNYQGLKQQRAGAYDNFLRSNIDNEQDKRNFNTEAGKDMLPFRSYETAASDVSNTVQNKIPDGAPGPVITATPGQAVLYPLRWNNPHSSELEVNVWIMNIPTIPNGVVVPIRKPTCSGEGHQDNVFSFTIPANFNSLGETIPGFTGCKKEGDCVLQVYAHSVEPRTYSIGIPIIVTGTVPEATATSPAGIQPVQQDVGMNLAALKRDICLSSVDPSADITVAVPRQARLVSDVFNHAYQNSDYSPYSGQQPEAISRNLQASAIISMIPANQGELGQALLKKQNPALAQKAANVRNTVQNLVKAYEGLVNKIIAQIGDKVMKNTATEGANGEQRLANCFRCAEVGAVTTTRQTTNTYIPSFQLPANQVAAAKALITNNKYEGLISETGVVQIYRAVLDDMSAEFANLKNRGLAYQPAIIKTSTATMNDATQFRKVDPANNNQRDNGVSAATKAQATKQAAANAVSQALNVGQTPLMSSLSADNVELPDIGTSAAVGMVDYHGLNRDTACDDDTKPTNDCTQQAEPLFAAAAAGSDDGAGLVPLVETSQTPTTAGSTINTGVIVGIAAGAGVLILIITGACVKYHRNKRNTVTSTTSTTKV